jgi:DNA-directed RNA polymerase II subunit RPB3
VGKDRLSFVSIMPNPRDPKVKVLELTEDKIRFEIRNTDLSMANSLRRIMIAEVPTLCIEFVEFEENSTSLQDEIIAHRLGLIPFRSDRRRMSEFSYHFACTCGSFCEKCMSIVKLDIEYEKLAAERFSGYDEPLTITSNDLICDDPNIFPAHFSTSQEQQHAQDRGIAIMTIGPRQRLKFTAFLRKGIGKEHAKWSPVATVAMKTHPIIRLDEDILNDYTEEEKNTLVQSCPKNVFKYDEGSRQVLIESESACIFCKECIYTGQDLRKRPEDHLPVSVEHSQTAFTFTVESTGALQPKEIVMDAFAVLEDKIKRVKLAALQLEI